MWGAAITTGLGLLANRIGNRQQVKQQEKLNANQLMHNKNLAKFSQELQLDTWKKTNYEEQVKHMKNAGLNPALMYGSAGQGGQLGSANAAGVSGGTAEGASAMGQMAIQAALARSQQRLTEAQAKKAEAETEKIKGVDTEATRAATEAQTIENAIKNLVGIENYAKTERWVQDKTRTESQKANAEWETYLAAGWKGHEFDDPNSPVAKAMKAGFEKAEEELKQAKTENKIKKAESIIREFEANLAKQGIPPNSPWGVKLTMDLARKAGIDLSDK